jgi:hypothetical protein
VTLLASTKINTIEFLSLLWNEEACIWTSIRLINRALSNYLIAFSILRHFKFSSWRTYQWETLIKWIFLGSKFFIWIWFISNLAKYMWSFFFFGCPVLEDLYTKEIGCHSGSLFVPLENVNVLPNLVKVRIFRDIYTPMTLLCKAKILHVEKVWISCHASKYLFNTTLCDSIVLKCFRNI